MADTIKFSQLGEISRAQMAGSDYAVGYKANGDNKKWTFENQADFLLNDSEAGQEFQETFVKVQDTEPTDENNKIWIEETPENEVEVPTYDEFEDLSNLVSGVNEAVFNKLSATADQLSTYIPFTFSTFAGKKYIIKNESSAGGMLARIRQTRDGENGTYITNGTQAGQTSVYEAAEDADYIAVMFGPTSTSPAFSIIQEGDVPSKVEDLKSAILNDRKSLNGDDTFVLMDLTKYPFLGYHLENGYWSVSTDYKCVLIPVLDIGNKVKFIATAYKCSYAFLKSDTIVVGEEPDLCDGESIETITIGNSATVDVPSDCQYMYVYVAQNQHVNFSAYSHFYEASVKALRDAISGIVEQVAEGYITKAYPNYELLENYYTSDAGNLTENNQYNTYVYKADRNMEIYFANESQTAIYISLVGYSSPNYDSSHRLFTRKRYTTSENTLPQANSKLSVSEGSYLAVSILKTEDFNMYGFKLVTKLSNNIPFNTSHIGKITEIANASSGRGFVQYQAESTAEASAEQLAVYIPSGNNYIKYRFVHTVYADRNADVWRMGIADVVDGNFQTIMPLTNGSEWECALKISGRSDFSGGYSHGDEIGTSLLVFVDGKLTTYNSVTTMTPFSELKLVTYSNLYDPADGTTLIATHGCERIFKDGDLYFNQVINWKQNETLAECYLAMLGPRKTTNNNIAITTDYYTDAKYDDETIPSPVARSVSGVTDVTMFANSGFMGSVRVIEYPKKELLVGGGGIIISDNGGQNYNKLYFPVCTSGSVSIGDVWKSRSVYRMNYTVN